MGHAMAFNHPALRHLCGGLLLTAASIASCHAVALSDAPIFSNVSVPGNLALALSVEYPTAISVANLGDYSHSATYLGYFDPAKCYTYTYDSSAPDNSYFQPSGKGGGSSGHDCAGRWSGNFMNWVSMPTIDPFRWVLTGGYRATDTANLTILQKAYGAPLGKAEINYPYRGTNIGAGNAITGSDVSRITPFSGTIFNSRIWGRGVQMQFSTANTNDYQSDNPPNQVHYGAGMSNSGNYVVRIRVRVCDSSSSAGGLEDNCVKYGDNYKPEGLMQKYSNKIRYSAFGYLNQGGDTRQGAVLRAQMGFIGPTKPVAMSTTPETNSVAEWNGTTGVMTANPDSALAASSAVTNSGVMNYLNQFGNYSSSYMTYDNVSELFYAVVRYFQNLGNVPEWTDNATIAQKDNFPAPSRWTDPILYACQKNFILGIGDSNTHYDVNTAGNAGLTNQNGATRVMPAAVLADTFNLSAQWTTAIEKAEGLTGRGMRYGENPGSEFIAGLAYGNHINDIRADLTGKQSIDTYWMDVMEGQYAQDKNPYWLATKYGGFSVSAGFDTIAPPVLQDSWWSSGTNISMYPRNNFSLANPAENRIERQRPNNYFLAGNANLMVEGLTRAFNSIAASVNAYTTAVMPSSHVISNAGTTSYSASYSNEYWSGTVKAATLSFTSSGSALIDIWSTGSTMGTQLSGAGWDSSRVVVTWNKDGTGGPAGVPFRLNSLSAGMKAALDTSYVSGDDSSNYLNYLRGDKSNEIGTTSGLHVYRTRSGALGDVVNSKLVLSAAPAMRYSEAYNKGYAQFKSDYALRTPLVLFGANDGMLHALNGNTSGNGAGQEVFAYIPSQTFYGPDGSTAAHANTNGLAALGDPAYAHRYYVDATPQVFDIDFSQTVGALQTQASWKTLVVGGMGKGGKGFYALDITDPSAMRTEAGAASKVLWEISNSTPGFENLGYSFGLPMMVKTAKYGWTLIFTSGYNNADGKGYLFLVNPRSGDLLETMATPTAAPGMAQASAFIKNYADGTADAVYAGDLNGQLWRFDLTKTLGAYDAPVVLFQAESPDGGSQPITVAPIPEIHPTTKNRVILFGTGQFLDGQDVSLKKRQSFYAVTDGNNSAFANAPSTTLTRSNLAAVASLTTQVSIPSSARGWYYDLGRENGVAWRMTVTPTAADGVAVFTAMLTSGDACSPAGKGLAYAVDYSSGYSVLTNPKGELLAYVGLNSTPTDNVLLKVEGVLRGSVGDITGGTTELTLKRIASFAVRLINWRELNAVD